MCRRAFALIALFAAPHAAAQPCIDYRENLHWVADLGDPYNRIHDVVVVRTVAVAVGGNTLDGDLFTFDVTYPEAPVELGAIPLPGSGRRVRVADGVAFVAATSQGLVSVDVSDPAAPAVLDVVSTTGSAYDVACQGNFVLVADVTLGVRVVDATDPSNLVVLGSSTAAASPVAIAVSGDYAYVADFGYGLRVLDISDPTNPIEVGDVSTLASNAVALEDGVVYLVDWLGLVAVDVSTPSAPAIIRTFFFTDDGGQGVGIAVEGPLAYIARGSHLGLTVMQVSPPEEPFIVGALDMSGAAAGVWVDGDRAYVPRVDRAPWIVDVSGPKGAETVGSLPTVAAVHVAFRDGHALVADAVDGLLVIDVADPTTPQLVITRPLSALELAVEGSLAVAGGVDGLTAFDVTTVTDPVEEGFVPTVSAVWDVYLADGIAYTTTVDDVQLHDFTDPALPISRGVIPLDVSVAIAAAPPYVYIGWAGLAVWDVSDLDDPAFVTLVPGGEIVDIVIEGSVLYAADWDLDGVRVFDISNPADPQQVSEIPLPSFPSGLSVYEDHVYAACAGAGTAIVDVTDPTAPFLLGQVQTPGTAINIAVADGFGYVADFQSLEVIPTQCVTVDVRPSTPSVTLPAFPTPTRAGVTVLTWADASGEVTARVFDPGGRVVRTLRQITPAGSVAVVWDGRDESGRPTPPGVYWLRTGGAGAPTTVSRIVVAR